MTNPVTTGTMKPARFPRKFCKPVQRPAMRGPASVCVIAQILDPHMPPAANASSSRITAAVGPARAHPRRSSPALPAPTLAKILRTRVGVPPVGNPAEDYCASRVTQISHAANFRHLANRKMPLAHQIIRQPGYLEVEHVICAEQAPARSPHRSLHHKIAKPCAAFLHVRTRCPCSRHPREPGNQPGHAEQPEHDKEG